MTVQQRFAAWVESLGSQATAAELLGVHQTQISRYCSGARIPGLVEAVRIEQLTTEAESGPIAVAEWAAAVVTGTDG